jgi:hypothetical protein
MIYGNTICVIKRTALWVGCNQYIVSCSWSSEGGRLFGNPRRRSEENTEYDIRNKVRWCELNLTGSGGDVLAKFFPATTIQSPRWRGSIAPTHSGP